MNPIVGVAPNQISLLDENISDYQKFEAAKEELVFCMFMAEKMKEDEQYKTQYTARAKELENYLSNQMSKNNNNNKNSDNKGCYVATMAFGSYDHPQVLLLRNYRDNILSHNKFGVYFISKYYKYSPALVKKLENRQILNLIIRNLLIKFCSIIKIIYKSKI